MKQLQRLMIQLMVVAMNGEGMMINNNNNDDDDDAGSKEFACDSPDVKDGWIAHRLYKQITNNSNHHHFQF